MAAIYCYFMVQKKTPLYQSFKENIIKPSKFVSFERIVD